jgi:hypothetical protein
MKTSSRLHVENSSLPRTSIQVCVVLLTMALAGTALAAHAIAASAVTADAVQLPDPTPTMPANALFAMTLPGEPNENQVLEIKPTESAFLSVATMNADIPLVPWKAAGWTVGKVIGEADAVPPDCALHSRLGTTHQVYAACQGPLKVSIPQGGGDFIYYVVFTGANNRIARVLRTGSLYNPDTSGLIP